MIALRRLRPKLPAGVGEPRGSGRAGRETGLPVPTGRALARDCPERACAAAGSGGKLDSGMAGPLCHFAADLHGSLARYDKLFAAATRERPAALLLARRPAAGLRRRGRTGRPPPAVSCATPWRPALARLRVATAPEPTRVFAVLGNDDPRSEEPTMRELERAACWSTLHGALPSLPRSPALRLRLRPSDAVPAQGLGALRRVPPPRSRRRLARGGRGGPCPVGAGTRSAAGRSPATSPRSRATRPRAGDLPLPRAAVRHAPRPRRARRQDGRPRAARPARRLDRHPALPRDPATARRAARARPRVGAPDRASGSTRLRRTVCLSAAHDGPELALVRFPLDAPAAARASCSDQAVAARPAAAGGRRR